MLCSAHLSRGQGPESAADILRSVRDTYAALGSFHFEAVEVTRIMSGGYERKTETRIVTARDASGRFLVTSDHPVDGGSVVFDGQTTWSAVARLREYTEMRGAAIRTAADTGAGAARHRRGADLTALQDHFPSRYRRLMTGLREASLPETGEVSLGGRKVPCLVIRAVYDAPRGVRASSIVRTYWIDPVLRIVLRERSVIRAERDGGVVESSQEVLFQIARVNESLADSLFTFDPPAGFEKVAGFGGQPAGPAALLGRQARGFALPDLRGNLHRLEDYGGKVILLNFWATWCAPCRVDMPKIEALHREFASKGLVVLGVNDEAPETARGYIEEHGYSFPTLADANKALYSAFAVRAIPALVVIGRDGKIVSYLTGAQAAKSLRRAIAEAGL